MTQNASEPTLLGDSKTVADSLLETDVINGLKTGDLPSPTRLGNSLYYRMRMTGTGEVWRADSGDTYRDPSKYVTPEFVSACIGLPLVMDHPASGRIGPDDTIVGTSVAAYLYNAESDTPEVWVIGRVINGEAQDTLLTEKMSTSPSVVVGESPDGFSEGSPLTLDHLALVPQGVWDHQGEPEGIDQEILLNDSQPNEVKGMTPEELEAKVEALVAQKLEAALAAHKGAEKTEADSLGLNPEPETAEQAVMADEGETEVKADACEEPGESGSHTVADADEAEEEKAAKKEAEAEVKADADEETKADADTEIEADAETTEEDEEVKNTDIAALKAELETLKKAIAGQSTLSDSEAAEMGNARLHADSALQSVGMAKMNPFPGEKALAYRKRVINALKCHSATMKDANVSAINDSATLDLIERQVFADAAAHSRSGAGIPKKTLRARKHTTDAGHTVIEYDGDPKAWLQETEIKPFAVGRV